MGIQYIPGPEQILVPAAEQISQGLAKFLNPAKDLQIATQRAMATNPELIQHMADMEASAPGTLHGLGLGPIADLVSMIPQSAAGAAEVAARPGAAKEAVAQQGARTATATTTAATATLNADVVKNAAKIMSADPSISFDTALRTLTGETAAGREATKREAQVKTEQAKQTLAQIQRARGLPEDLSKVDWTSEARDFLDGNLSGAAATAYFGNRDTQEAFSTAIHGVLTQRQLDAQKALAAQRGDKSVDNFRTQKAFQEYEKSGGVGNLDSWQKFLFSPEAQDKARALMSGAAKPANQEDRDLLQIAKVTKTQIDTDKLRDITSVNDKIATQMKRVDTAASDQEREVGIQGLNELLKQRANLGGLKVTATYNDRGFWLPGRVEYKTPDGRMVDEAVVNAVIADPTAADITKASVTMSDKARQALTLIQNFQGDKLAAFNKYRMQDTSPNKENSRAVEAELMKAGVLKRVGGGK